MTPGLFISFESIFSPLGLNTSWFLFGDIAFRCAVSPSFSSVSLRLKSVR